MATTEALLHCLAGTQSPDGETRQQAELQLRDFSVTHGFGIALLELLLSPQVEIQIRQLSAVLCRQYIHVHWSRHRQAFQEPEVTEEHKANMRGQLLGALSLEHSKLRTAVSMAVASVAKDDFPDRWPELIPHLMGMLQAGAPHLVHGAMRCLVLVSEEITDDQVPHVITSLFPHLYNVFVAADVYSKPVRARTCTVLYKCIKLISILGDASESEAKSLELLQQTVPAWFEMFASILSAPLAHDDAGELCLRIEIVRILTVIVENYPRLLSSCVAPIIQAIWQALSGIVEVYEQVVVHGTAEHELELDPADDVDGDRISVEALAWELMECVREVVACRHTRKYVKDELRPLAFTQIRYMQVTADQLEAWSTDVNAYIAHEDEGSFETSVRISAAEVFSEICESFGAEGWQAVLSAVMAQLQASAQAQQAGVQNWWMKREASIFAVSVVCADADLQGLSAIFRPADFVREVVLPDISPSTPPVLRGRALHCISSFARWVPQELAGQCFQAAAMALSEDSSLPVRMTAARAIGSLAVAEGEGGIGGVLGQEFLRPHVPTLIQSIAALLSHSSEDSALITLEALHQILKIPSPEALPQMPPVIQEVLLALGRCAGDIMIASEAVETIEEIVEVQGCIVPVAEACAPFVMSVLQNPEKYICTQVESVLELLSKIIRKPPGVDVYSGPLLDPVFPTLMVTMLTSTNEDIIQPGCDCLRAYIREAKNETLAVMIGDKPALECYLAILARLLAPEASEGTSARAATLLLHFILRCKDLVQSNIPAMLAAALDRLVGARTLPLRQALVMLFARLLNEEQQSTVAFLRQMTVMEGQNALSVLLVQWLRDQHDFCGNYDMKVLVSALGGLLMLDDAELMGLPVPGARMVNAEEGRMTRGQARILHGPGGQQEQWTQVPFAVKALQVVLETIRREEEEERREDSDLGDSEDDYFGSDDDDEDQDEDAPSAGGMGRHSTSGMSGSSDFGGSPGAISTSPHAGPSIPPGEETEATQREIIKTIRAGMHKLREEETDKDHLQDLASKLILKEHCVNILSTLASHQSQKLTTCMDQLPSDLRQVALAHLNPSS